MKKVLLHTALLSPILFSASCKKTTCPAYYKYPDCKVEVRSRFYGMYRGTCAINLQGPYMTQWEAKPGVEISEIAMANGLILILDARDPRSFTVKDRSRFNEMYIRTEGSKGMFTDDSMTISFYMDEGAPVEPNEPLTHYTFKGKKK